LIEPTEADAARRCELCLQLGNAAWRAGDGRSARASFEEAARIARRLDAPELFARAALGYVTGLGGFLLFARFEVGDTGADLLEEALERLPVDDSALRARILARLAVEMYSADELVEQRLRLSEEAISTARRLRDSEALVTALHARHWALAPPDLVLERLANSEEILRVAGEIGSREMAFLAHNARFDAALERCDGDGVDVEIEAMAQVAEDLRQPFYRWHVDCLRVVRATLDGRFAEAEELANEALRLGRSHFSEYAGYVFGYAQIVAIRWAQGRLAQLRAVLAPHGERYPWVPRWRDALVAAECGDEEAARVELERHGARGFADLSRDGLWLIHLCALAECAVLIGEERRAADLHELLRPYAEHNAVSYTLQPFGPVALRLGMLARVLGRWEEAERQFETAARCCEGLGASAVRARVAFEHARMLIARGEGDDRARARELLGEGVQLADDSDATGLLARISALADELEPAERARVSVTKAIKTAIRAVRHESPELAEHLTASIRTGRFCRYAPPGAAPPRWRLN
jgi:eukaryotic-like serine/threonine-protein kinase